MKIKKVYLGTHQIYPDVWHPGTNTVAYYKFDGNLNDSSGNNHNLTGGTFTYGTLQTGAKYIQTALGQCTDAYNQLYFNSSNYTINVRAKIESSATSGSNAIIDVHTNKSNFPRFYFTGLNAARLTTNATTASSITPGEWHNYCLVMSNNNLTTSYIDGVVKATATITAFDGNVPYFRINALGTASIPVTDWSGVNKISEAIFESKQRTAQEISDYYNKTKSNYGL